MDGGGRSAVVSELPGSGVGGGAGPYVVSPLWSPAWQEQGQMGTQGRHAVVSELSAYGELERDQ